MESSLAEEYHQTNFESRHHPWGQATNPLSHGQGNPGQGETRGETRDSIRVYPISLELVAVAHWGTRRNGGEYCCCPPSMRNLISIVSAGASLAGRPLCATRDPIGVGF